MKQDTEHPTLVYIDTHTYTHVHAPSAVHTHRHAHTHVHLYKESCIIWGSKMTFLVTPYICHSLLVSSFYQLGWSLVITHLY